MKKANLISTVLLVFGLVFFSSSSISQTPAAGDASKGGSVCVLPNPPERPTQISPGGDYNPDTLTVRIDKREAIHWPHKVPVLIEGLDLQDKHLIVLATDGRRMMSALFRFTDPYYHDDHLCAYFDGYQGIQIGNRSDALWCKSKKRSCWP